jgi:NhaP-type Na+/H+ or K+/H+ antiporter
MRTNDVRVALAGTVAWAVALVVLLVAGTPSGDRWWLWVCATGIVTGLFGIWYIPRLQAGRERQEAERAARRAAAVEDAVLPAGGDPDGPGATRQDAVAEAAPNSTTSEKTSEKSSETSEADV